MADMYGWDGTQWVRINVTGGGSIVVGAVANRPSFAVNQKTVAAHGTAEQLQSQAIPDGFSVSIRAFDTNTKNIYLGPTKADAQNHTKATVLSQGQFVLLYITDVSEVWIDADVNGEGVMWLVEV
jgi:hypothetical protein